MPSRNNLHNSLILLPFIVYCASCAARQKPCIPCSLSCDGAHDELEKHQRVRVYVEHFSERLHDEIHNVSSLFKGEGRCSVAVSDCSKWGTPITVQIYAEDEESVPERLYIKTDLKPEPGGADGNLPNTLLILLAALLLHLLPP